MKTRTTYDDFLCMLPDDWTCSGGLGRLTSTSIGISRSTTVQYIARAIERGVLEARIVKGRRQVRLTPIPGDTR